MADNGGNKREHGKDKERLNDKNPEVTVIIPAYRCAKTIDQAIQSVLIQDVSVIILVINDQSPDDLDQVMEKYTKDSRVIYVKNERNLGAAASRNKGVAMARTPYIAFLDSDDCWRAGKLKKQLACMENTNIVLCSTARELMDVNGVKTGRIFPVKEHLTYKEILKHNSIVCSSVLLRTEVAKAFPMEHEDSHEDYILWMRILKKFGAARGINEPLVLYRLSAKGKSGNKWKSARMTLKAYRYMGFSWPKSLCCFVCYAWNGIMKYYLKDRN